ncbi:MAG: M1 family metallopeptidase [Flavobacteriales bacterium]|jgi:leukotriene-A4 hydrolase|tara:strand:- start:8046 stop:9872 length:1827 start_codon:yes stop_codon:yes gene_type:complete
MNKILSFLVTALLFTSCGAKKDLRVDKHSFSEPHNVRTTHLDLDVKVDFETERISGIANYTIENINGSKELILDANGLRIDKVTSGGKDCAFKLTEKDSILGQGLIIEIEKGAKQVAIHYQSAPNSKALQWLNPKQTAGKKHPFLFTQSQAILARTWLPCQDSPGVRFSYTAKVQVPAELLAVMSAENPTEKNTEGIYTFKMEQAIPAYLMALGVGNLEFQNLGEHTGIYAEPEMIEKAAYEFAETENMLEIAESMYGKYAWDRYDMLLLPPSFPFGGMENPRLTFVTPTILAGDRSLTALIAHELAHSWSGNLVTNKTWDDFWLNEGFTVYFERRIMERMEDKDYADMLALLGKQDLEREVESLGHNHKDTHLKLDLLQRDPDDGMTDIAYEKGFFLLRLIEETVGRKQFDFFLNNYFTENAFKVMDTEEFIVYINEKLLDTDIEAKEKIRLEEWIYRAGIPDNCPEVNSTKFKNVDNAIHSFEKGYPLANINSAKWSSHEWLHFLRKLPKDSSLKDLKKLDTAFEFTTSGNSEILNAWFQLTIPTGYKVADNALEDFLMTVGRRKFLQPLYEALYMKDPLRAKRIYKNARENYHSVSTQTLDAIVL